ncbi:MAG TPA: arginine--tRNA ligase [Bacteroidia bacterium]|jgi:arginyl-tRNA synthetase|nr:arginine--tRNA ligase [Bacteroidia bacterium]
MQSPENIISFHVAKAVETLFNQKIDPATVTFQRTNPQFEGDITLVVFPYVKLAGKGPEQTAQLLGEELQKNYSAIARFNVVKGFLNIVLGDQFWLDGFIEICKDESFGIKKLTENAPLVMVEYSSPNTNKPLHLGHIRNNLLGYSVAQILKSNGNNVKKVNLVNDRGIHICKSMLAWQKFGNGETPESSGMKGDHLVGKYYVIYNVKESEEIESIYKHLVDISNELNSIGKPNETFNSIVKDYGITDKEAFKNRLLTTELGSRKDDGTYYLQSMPPELFQKVLDWFQSIRNSCFAQTKEMLRKWEANDPEVKALWNKMNGWVYDGFAITYKKLGVDFDKTYYESQTYLLGKTIVEEGLKKGVLQKRPDGAVIIDNTDSGLDVKVLLRSDGTSVYMTQDLGTAEDRYREFHFSKHIYVVGNEQDYHFKTLKVSLKKLGNDWADGLYHLSYGMVELPEGKMKSREGTVVDADDLIDAMEQDALELANEKGMTNEMSEEEKKDLAHKVGMAALKYFILKVDPKKKMLFDPKESIDLHGNTGPFVQYTYARIRSIWRKSELKAVPVVDPSVAIHPKEKELIKHLYSFPTAVDAAAKELSPAVIANYVYDLAKTFNQFYDACPVLKEENETLKNFRLALSVKVAKTIKKAMNMLGIDVPERM